MPLLNFKKSLARPQAIKTSVSEAATRKVNRMFDDVAKQKVNVSKTPPQAVKVPGKMGPTRRNDQATGNTRKSAVKRSTGGHGGGSSRIPGKGLFNRIIRRL
jgi:hypothetical protein